mmetsp:Transcript_12885/g.32190  ORF Transcript_12885/g.32190 Transcript_12885/m.32190 type:complete len:356 (+) Transcript_12885:71-1138(+)
MGFFDDDLPQADNGPLTYPGYLPNLVFRIHGCTKDTPPDIPGFATCLDAVVAWLESGYDGPDGLDGCGCADALRAAAPTEDPTVVAALRQLEGGCGLRAAVEEVVRSMKNKKGKFIQTHARQFTVYFLGRVISVELPSNACAADLRRSVAAATGLHPAALTLTEDCVPDDTPVSELPTSLCAGEHQSIMRKVADVEQALRELQNATISPLQEFSALAQPQDACVVGCAAVLHLLGLPADNPVLEAKLLLGRPFAQVLTILQNHDFLRTPQVYCHFPAPLQPNNWTDASAPWADLSECFLNSPYLRRRSEEDYEEGEQRQGEGASLLVAWARAALAVRRARRRAGMVVVRAAAAGA